MAGIPVPIVQQRVRDESQLPGYRQNLRASPDAFGGAIGEGVAKAAQAAGGIYVKEQEDAASTALMRGQSELAAARLEADQRFSSLAGVDALDPKQREAITKAYEARVAKAGEAIPKLAKPRWDASFVPGNATQLQASFQSHEAQQRTVVDDQSETGVLDTSVQAAALQASKGDVGEAAVELMPGRAALLRRGKRLGWDEQTRIDKLREYDTVGKSGIIKALLVGEKWELAESFLKDNRESMDQAKVAVFDEAIQAVSLKERAASTFDSAWLAAKGDVKAVVQSIRDNPDKKLSRAMMPHLQDRVTTDDALVRSTDREPEARIGITLIGKPWSDVTAHPDWSGLSDSARERVLDRQRVLQRTRKDAGASDRREQAAADKLAIEYLGSLKEDELQALDVEVDPNDPTKFRTQDPVLSQASDWVGKRAIKFKNGIAKSDAQSVSAFRTKVTALVKGMKPDKQAGAVAEMVVQYSDYVEENGGQKPDPKIQAGWVADALVEKGQPESDYSVFQTKMPGWLAKQKGITNYVPIKSEANQRIIDQVNEMFSAQGATSPIEPGAPAVESATTPKDKVSQITEAISMRTGKSDKDITQAEIDGVYAAWAKVNAPAPVAALTEAAAPKTDERLAVYGPNGEEESIPLASGDAGWLKSHPGWSFDKPETVAPAPQPAAVAPSVAAATPGLKDRISKSVKTSISQAKSKGMSTPDMVGNVIDSVLGAVEKELSAPNAATDLVVIGPKGVQDYVTLPKDDTPEWRRKWEKDHPGWRFK